MPAQLTDNQRAWVAKLRDPELNQAHGKLKKYAKDGTPSYCCLGVLTELSGLCVEARNNEYGVSFVDIGAGEDAEFYESYPAATVRKWGGTLSADASGDMLLDWGTLATLRDQGQWDADPSWNRDNIGHLSLASLNDFGFSFNQIADLIEYLGIKP